MSEGEGKHYTDFVLPQNLVSKMDISRLVKEVERVDNELTTASVHEKVGADQGEKPVYSEHLTSFLEQNQLSLDDSHQRTELIKQMRELKDKLPVIHMTFSVPADGQSLQQIAKWLRESIHPQTVIDVGLQPALVAGVYLRTPNHVMDLSLRAALDGHREDLARELETIRGTK